MKSIRILGVVGMIMLPQTVWSADSTAPIVVSASRTAQTADEVMAPVTVITRQQIEQRQVRSVAELMQATAGFSISNNGGAGKTSSVFLRGTESDHVLVLIDGIKVGSATLGTTPFEFLPIDQIERIEVVRGPRSHLYGSEAIGGVIQIFTKKGGGELTPTVRVGGGSFGTKNGAVSVSGGGDRGWFNVGVSAEQTDGYNSCTGLPNIAGCFTNEPDDDGHESDSANIRAGYRFSNDAELDFHWLNTNNETDFDGSFQNGTETEQEVAGLSFRIMPTENLELNVTAGKSKDLSENFLNGVFASYFDTERDSVNTQATYFAGDNHTVVAGADYRDDTVTSSSAFAVDSRDNTGIYLEYLGSFGDRDVQVGVRNDDDEQFGSKTTGGITLGQRLNGGQQLTFAYGTAYKAPTFNELYFPGFGNANLDPEESTNYEIGIAGSNGNWSVNIFNTEIDELIGFDPNTFAPVNIDSARIRGMEIVAGAQLADWDVSGTLTLLDPENQAAGSEGNVLPRRAKRSLRIDLDRDFGRFTAGASLVSEGKKYDDLANTREIDSYVTVAARASITIAKTLQVQLKIDNLFDEEYETASYYPQPERSYFITLRYTPKAR
jgi:vitamin B12 transporter